MRSIFLAAAFLALAILPAQATGAISCTIEDKSLDLSFEGIFSHGVGEGLTDVRGELKAKVDLLANIKSATLERRDVTQFWMFERSLQLRIYRESAGEPHETLDLVIETIQDRKDEMSYSGTYKGTASHFDQKTGPEAKTKTFKGRVSCSVG